MATEVSVKDYAAQRNKTVQAVYQQMKTAENAAAIEGHVIIRRVGNKNVKFLDEVAVDVLDRASSSAPVMYIQEDLKTELEETRKQLKATERQMFMLEGRNQSLKDMLEQRDSNLRLLTESSSKEIAELTAQNAALASEKVSAVVEAQAAKNDVDKLTNELEDVRTELETIKSKWWYRLFAKKGNKNDGNDV